MGELYSCFDCDALGKQCDYHQTLAASKLRKRPRKIKPGTKKPNVIPNHGWRRIDEMKANGFVKEVE